MYPSYHSVREENYRDVEGCPNAGGRSSWSERWRCLWIRTGPELGSASGCRKTLALARWVGTWSQRSNICPFKKKNTLKTEWMYLFGALRDGRENLQLLHAVKYTTSITYYLLCASCVRSIASLSVTSFCKRPGSPAISVLCFSQTVRRYVFSPHRIARCCPWPGDHEKTQGNEK